MALLLSFLSLLAALSPPPAQGPQALAPAATLRWTHSTGPVHARGSVPVPANFDIDSAWALAPSGASPIPAQLEVVTRGPGGAPEVDGGSPLRHRALQRIARNGENILRVVADA